jgi:hypothetical protein
MAIPDAGKQAAIDGYKTFIGGASTWVSLHTGAGGGTTGANEASGGGYARKQSVLTSGSTGTVTGTQVNISCAAGTYTEGGVWTAVTAGTFGGSSAFTAGSVVVSGAGASINVTPSASTT